MLSTISPVLEGAEGMNHKAALVLANRAGDMYDNQLPVFEDLLTAKMAGYGFEIIGRELVIDAVSRLESGSNENPVDAMMDNQTSAIRLAESLGADYLIFATIAGYDTEKRSVNAYDVKFTNNDHKLRATYRIVDGTTGAAMIGGTVSARRGIQQSEQSQTDASGMVSELLEDAASQIADGVQTHWDEDRIRAVEEADALVDFQVEVSLSDVNFPEVIFEEGGQARITGNQTRVQPLAVAVELDGMVLGTTGAESAVSEFRVKPGIHRIRLSREDLETWERNINVYDGMKLTVAMQLNDRGMERWRENTRLLNELKQETVLTEARAESLRGLAQKLRQSGYQVDIKVETDEGIQIDRSQSLMNMDN